MKELNYDELNMVSGGKGPGIDPANAQVLKDIAIDVGIGAALTPSAPMVGGGLAAVGSVIHGAINHGPVNVPVPVLIGPSWNGSGNLGGGSMADFCAAKGMPGEHCW